MDMMFKKPLFAALVVALFTSELLAGPFGLVTRRRGTSNTAPAGTATTSYAVDGELYSAQGVANRMARLLRMAHLGNPTGGYEGVGMGSTPDHAISNCCYYGRRTLRDSGVAQGANGMWYACCRYY